MFIEIIEIAKKIIGNVILKSIIFNNIYKTNIIGEKTIKKLNLLSRDIMYNNTIYI